MSDDGDSRSNGCVPVYDRCTSISGRSQHKGRPMSASGKATRPPGPFQQNGCKRRSRGSAIRQCLPKDLCAYHHPLCLNQRIGTMVLVKINANPNGYPHVQLNSGIFLKFIPYMLAMSVGGIPTTDAIVRTLKISFCSVLMN